MKYMLDTNVCIHVMKQKPLSVMENFRRHASMDVCISSITYAELCHGVDKSRNKEQNRLALSVLLAGIQIIPFDSTPQSFTGLRFAMIITFLPIRSSGLYHSAIPETTCLPPIPSSSCKQSSFFDFLTFSHSLT